MTPDNIAAARYRATHGTSGAVFGALAIGRTHLALAEVERSRPFMVGEFRCRCITVPLSDADQSAQPIEVERVPSAAIERKRPRLTPVQRRILIGANLPGHMVVRRRTAAGLVNAGMLELIEDTGRYRITDAGREYVRSLGRR